MKNLTKALAIAGVLGVAAVPAHAQTSVNGSSTISIGTVLYISAANTNVAFGAPTTGDFDVGFIDAPTATLLSHKANVRHSVTVKASSATMTATGGGTGADAARAAKPAADLLWSTDGSAFSGLSTSAAPVRSGVSRGSYDDLAVWYRMALDYGEDTPGTYGLNFLYTIVAD